MAEEQAAEAGAVRSRPDDAGARPVRSPREVAEQVRRMVAGEDVVFADLFAADAVFTYPFAPPGQPGELAGQDAIRSFFGSVKDARSLFRMDGVEAVIRQTDDPEVVVAEIRHHGWSHVTSAPYEHTALGVIRVRDGLIVRYDDYMNPIALARLLGRTSELAAALAAG
jgi:ketosteroid isomerase-like protein